MTTLDAQFDRDHEMAHEPGTDETWQESVLMLWYDDARGIGGYHRIGHEVPRANAATWAGLVAADGSRFRRQCPELPLLADDRTSNRFGAGEQGLLRREHDLLWQLDDPDCHLELALEDFYIPRALWEQQGADVSAATISNHYEASGRAVGELRWNGETIAIDALFHRDHSWGPRDWEFVVNHRWFTGTVGPDLSFSIAVMHGADGRGMAVGGVVRDGVLSVADDIDLVRYEEMDGISHRGGHATITLADGEVLEITAESLDGILFEHRGFVGISTPCRVTLADGRVGGGVLEASSKLAWTVPTARRAVVADGLVPGAGYCAARGAATTSTSPVVPSMRTH